MNRHRIGVAALASAAVVAVVAAALPAATSSAGAATPGHARRVLASNFPDPGFAKFGTYYYLYKTGKGFGESTSVYPARGYSAPVASMPKPPAWVGNGADGNPHLWAPHVFGLIDQAGRALYVMYFTGYSRTFGSNCIGVATSRSPSRDFVAKRKATVCPPSNYYEAIDPAAYLAKDGKRYLIYKVNHANVSGFDIRAVQMDSATGTSRVAGVKSRSKIKPGARMEAPSVISHGGKVWMFTSRGNWADCTYSTDVWRANTFWNGTFKRVRTVMSSASTGLCGPGGATVLQDGKTTRIAFHAWKSGTPSSKVRQTWVGVLKWNSAGSPYLY